MPTAIENGVAIKKAITTRCAVINMLPMNLLSCSSSTSVRSTRLNGGNTSGSVHPNRGAISQRTSRDPRSATRMRRTFTHMFALLPTAVRSGLFLLLHRVVDNHARRVRQIRDAAVLGKVQGRGKNLQVNVAICQ